MKLSNFLPEQLTRTSQCLFDDTLGITFISQKVYFGSHEICVMFYSKIQIIVPPKLKLQGVHKKYPLFGDRLSTKRNSFWDTLKISRIYKSCKIDLYAILGCQRLKLYFRMHLLDIRFTQKTSCHFFL